MNQPINENDPNFDKLMELLWSQDELPHSVTTKLDLTFEQVMERYGDTLTDIQIKKLKDYAEFKTVR